jgi:hypothetical protein
VLVDNHIGSYGRECAIRPNKLYLIEEKEVIASISAFAVSNSLHGKCPRTAGTGTFHTPPDIVVRDVAAH